MSEWSLKKRAYGYLILSSVSELGDSFFTYFCVLAVIDFKLGGTFSACILGISAVVRIVVAPWCARRTDTIADKDRRVRMAMGVELLLVAFAFVPLLVSPSASSLSSLLFLAILFVQRVLLLLDAQLRMHLFLSFDEAGLIPVNKGVAIGNIGTRAAQALTPALAAALGPGQWLLACAINSVTYLFALGASLLGRSIVRTTDARQTSLANAPIATHVQESYARWYCYFLFLSNVSFGCLAMVLLKQMKLETSPIPPLTVLYIGMTLSLMSTLARQAKPLPSNPLARICSLLLGMTFCLLVYLVSPIWVAVVAMGVLGYLYGSTITVSAQVILPKLRGSSLLRHSSNGQAWGRMGSLVSYFAAGAALDLGWSTTQILVAVTLTSLVGTGALWSKIKTVSLPSKKLNP